MAIAEKLKLPWLWGVLSSSFFITRAAAPTAAQRTPSSPATTRLAFSDFVLLRISASRSACASPSPAFNIAGPIAASNFSFVASASYCLKNATACSVVKPFVYSGNGCVEMRIVSTAYPRDSKVVCARLNIFSASATCSLYCARSRLINAVIARILGFAGTGEVFACARTIPQLQAKASNSTAAEFRRNRVKVSELGRMGQCSCNAPTVADALYRIQDSHAVSQAGLKMWALAPVPFDGKFSPAASHDYRPHLGLHVGGNAGDA